jgi:hypothetical protein
LNIRIEKYKDISEKIIDNPNIFEYDYQSMKSNFLSTYVNRMAFSTKQYFEMEGLGMERNGLELE